MRIGFDVDGVLASFEKGYAELIMKTSGRDLFPTNPRPWHPFGEPPTWYWTQHFGYTNEEDAAAWKAIKSDPTFWENLEALPGAKDLYSAKNLWVPANEIYFITNRMGIDPKRQTERFLYRKLVVNNPTVLISEEKGAACKALHLDCYIDDKDSNVADAASARWLLKGDKPLQPTGRTRVYCLDKPYNQDINGSDYTRVKTVREMLEAEGLL